MERINVEYKDESPFNDAVVHLELEIQGRRRADKNKPMEKAANLLERWRMEELKSEAEEKGELGLLAKPADFKVERPDDYIRPLEDPRVEPKEPYPYQKEVIEWAGRLWGAIPQVDGQTGVCIALPPGTGKTFVASTLMEKHLADVPILLIVPKSVQHEWAIERVKMFGKRH